MSDDLEHICTFVGEMGRYQRLIDILGETIENIKTMQNFLVKRRNDAKQAAESHAHLARRIVDDRMNATVFLTAAKYSDGTDAPSLQFSIPREEVERKLRARMTALQGEIESYLYDYDILQDIVNNMFGATEDTLDRIENALEQKSPNK